MSIFASEIAPKGLQFNPSDFVVSDKYATILTVVSFPTMISPGYLAGLTSMSGVKVVIKHIPIPFDTIRKMLNKQLADLRTKYEEEKDRTRQEQIRQDNESIESFVQQLVANQDLIFDFQLHVLVTADTRETLELRKTNVKNYLDSMELRAKTLRFEQETIFKSMMPIFPKQKIEERIGTPIPSVSVAAMYPFIFDSIKDPGLSNLIGIDASGGVILFNQFLYKIRKENNRNNANMVILGSTGSGKSTAAKLLMRGHIRNNCQIVAIDPENELYDMCQQFGGDSIDLGKGGAYGLINPLEIVMDFDEEEAFEGLGSTLITQNLNSLKAFLRYYYPDIEDDVLTLFSEVVQDTYARFGIRVDTNFFNMTSQDFPTFSNVYETVRHRLTATTEKTHERDVLERLELKLRPFTRELKYLFDGHTSIPSNSDFIVFNIRELMNTDSNIRNALFFNVLKYAWGLCLDRRRDTVLMVDEAHVLLSGNNILGANFLEQVQRRARKYNTGTIIITQQPSDFTNEAVITQAKAIFGNASYYMIMLLNKQSVEDLAKLVDLNDNEKDVIKRFQQGQALFVCGNKRMQIDVIVTAEELDSFGDRGGL